MEKRFLRSLPLLVVALLATACCSPTLKKCATTPPPPAPPAPRSDLDKDMLVLSIISATGDALTGSDEKVARELVPCIREELQTQPVLSTPKKDKWQLVWGPMVFKFNIARFDDNMMYVVSPDAGKTLVVSIRGTNAIAILDWIEDDLDVFRHLVEWPYGDAPGLKPKISRATHMGLKALQGMVPPEDAPGTQKVPGAGQSLRELLGQADSLKKVIVTGHSLGGALAPTLALWLADTRSEWNGEKVELEVWAYAGPTAGNADFAEYSGMRLDKIHRIFNRHDVVPKAWSVCSLAEIPDIYEPAIKMPDLLKGVVDLAIDGVCKKQYTQLPGGAYLDVGVYDTKCYDKYFTQLAWQHTCGYICGLGLGEDMKKLSNACTKPSDACKSDSDSDLLCTCP